MCLGDKRHFTDFLFLFQLFLQLDQIPLLIQNLGISVQIIKDMTTTKFFAFSLRSLFIRFINLWSKTVSLEILLILFLLFSLKFLLSLFMFCVQHLGSALFFDALYLHLAFSFPHLSLENVKNLACKVSRNTSILIDFLFNFGLKVVSVTFGCSSSFSLFFYISWSATTFPYHCMNFSLSLKIFLNSITILRSVQTFWDSKKEIIRLLQECCFLPRQFFKFSC